MVISLHRCIYERIVPEQRQQRRNLELKPKSIKFIKFLFHIVGNIGFVIVWGMSGFSLPNNRAIPIDAVMIVVGAFIMLKCIRSWRVFRLSETTLKKRYLERDLPKFISTIGLLLPFVWTLTPALDAANYEGNQICRYSGAIVYLCGLFIIYRAHSDLGDGFSPTLDIQEEQKLATKGIYKDIRHPMYIGFLLFSFGQALAIPNFVVGFGGVLGILQLIAFRVPAEERMLLDEFGDEYVAYSANTKRLIPRVW